MNKFDDVSQVTVGNMPAKMLEVCKRAVDDADKSRPADALPAGVIVITLAKRLNQEGVLVNGQVLLIEDLCPCHDLPDIYDAIGEILGRAAEDKVAFLAIEAYARSNPTPPGKRD